MTSRLSAILRAVLSWPMWIHHFSRLKWIQVNNTPVPGSRRQTAPGTTAGSSSVKLSGPGQVESTKREITVREPGIDPYELRILPRRPCAMSGW